MVRKAALLLCLVQVTAGCATSFNGSAKVDGPIECRKTCKQWGMDLAGMVAMGRYTDGCICKVRGEELSLRDAGQAVLTSSVGAAAGGVAAYTRMQDK